MFLLLLCLEHVVLSYYVNLSCIKYLLNKDQNSLDLYTENHSLGTYIVCSPVTVYMSLFEVVSHFIEKPDFINNLPESLGLNKNEKKPTKPSK